MSGFVYLVAWRFIGLLPQKISDLLFARIARIQCSKNGKAVQQLRHNLSVVTKLEGAELEQVVEAGMISYSRYWSQVFRLPRWSDQEVLRKVRVVNEGLILDAIKLGRPVIAAVTHMGNWDLAGRWFAIKLGRIFTVVEHLKPERVFKAFLNYRTKIGFVAFPTKDRSTVPNLLTALNEPNLIALVSDRDMSSSGVIVDLLGSKASFPSGPASLAYKTKAALVTVEIYNDGDGIVIVVEPEIEIQYLAPKDLEVKRVTQEIANRFSRHISSHPQDWHVLQRVFLDA